MRRNWFLAVAVAGLMIAPAAAQETLGGLLEVSEAAICTRIVDREPVGAAERFAAGVGKLYCYSRVANVTSATTIEHVWYHGNLERARVRLPVKPPAWRTWSAKRIMAHETGRWRVEVLDAGGNTLRTIAFEILP